MSRRGKTSREAVTELVRQRAERYRAEHGHYPEWWLATSSGGPEVGTPAARPVATVASQQKTPPRKKADLEGILGEQLRVAGLPEPAVQYRWWPGRRFKADFAYAERRLLIEVQGGVFGAGAGGRHNRGKGYEDDRMKYNEAQLRGWRVLEFGPNHVTSGEALTVIERALAAFPAEEREGEGPCTA